MHVPRLIDLAFERLVQCIGGVRFDGSIQLIDYLMVIVHFLDWFAEPIPSKEVYCFTIVLGGGVEDYDKVGVATVQGTRVEICFFNMF